MKRLVLAIALSAGALLALLAPGAAQAHPLGNFSTNRYAELVVSGDRLYVLAVVDLAEIPTFQAKDMLARLGRAAYADRVAGTLRRGIELRIDGERRTLTRLGRRITFLPGAAELQTTRVEAVFGAGRLEPGATASVQLASAAFDDRVGWAEIVVRGERGAVLADATAPAVSVSNRLRRFPRDLLTSPPDVTAASATVTAGDLAGTAPSLGPAAGAPVRVAGRSERGFAALIAERDVSAGFVALAFVLALFWGAAHALTPGHGKAIVAAYLVGSEGRARDAFVLGGIVTVTHTIGVFALGIVTLALSALIVPEDLYPWLNLVSAVLVVVVGLAVVRQRLKARRAPASPEHARLHRHHHDHEVVEAPARTHLPEQGSGKKGLLAAGISGGLLPCPTALVVLLAAISLHRVALGLVLIVAFSVGLAAVITGIGLLAIGARRIFARATFQGPLVRAVPTVSAVAIVAVGVAMTVRALPKVI